MKNDKNSDSEKIIERMMLAGGFKQIKDLAGVLGCDPTNISQWKKRIVPHNAVALIASKYNKDIAWMYDSQTQIKYLAGAGNPHLSSGEVVISITLPLDFTKNGIVPVMVKGDSMHPILLDGAIVGVDTNNKEVKSGKMYAVWIEDEGAQIKTLIRGHEKVTVKSENPLAPTVDYPSSVLKDHFILGKVVWWINQDSGE